MTGFFASLLNSPPPSMMPFLTAGILTSGLTPCSLGACARGPRHWRARSHREITRSFSKVSLKFPKFFCKSFVSVFLSRAMDF